MRAIVAVVVSAGLVAGGCAGSGEQPGRGARPGPASPTSTPASPGAPQPTPSPTMVEPREGLVDVEPQSWEKAEVLGERELLIAFHGGVEACYGVDRVEVDYGPKRVVVTLYTGRVPEAEVCIEVAVYQGVRVTLEEPLGDRKVVDGAEDEAA